MTLGRVEHNPVRGRRAAVDGPQPGRGGPAHDDAGALVDAPEVRDDDRFGGVVVARVVVAAEAEVVVLLRGGGEGVVARGRIHENVGVGLAPPSEVEREREGFPFYGVRQQLVAVVRTKNAIAALCYVIVALEEGRRPDAHDLVAPS